MSDTLLMKPAILLLTISLFGYGQPAARSPKYEVASIKPNTDSDYRFAFRIEPGGTLAATGITLQRLLMTAYNVQGFRIVGGPDWLTSKRWDLQAKPDAPASPGQVRPMLRALLEERFQLHSHSEKRNLPVYELVIADKGSKVPRAAAGEAPPSVRVANGSIQLTKALSSTFASQLSYALGRPVIDKTELAGEYDFALQWTPVTGEDGGPTSAGLPYGTPEEPAATQNGPSIFTAIQEQLGLRVRSGRGPVDVLVIDSVQAPTAN